MRTIFFVTVKHEGSSVTTELCYEMELSCIPRTDDRITLNNANFLVNDVTFRIENGLLVLLEIDLYDRSVGTWEDFEKEIKKLNNDGWC